MANDKQRRIINFVFNTSDLSERVRAMFGRWLLDDENRAASESIMEELWNSHEAPADPEANRRGLARLHASIGLDRRRRHSGLRLALRVAAAAACAVAVFGAGYLAAVRTAAPVEEVTLLTAKGNVGEFTLPDGTRVWLNGGSRLSYRKEFDGATRDVALRGEAYFDVERDVTRPFRVEMNSMNVEVLGTEFDAMSYDYGSSEEVVLRSGSVKVEGAGLRQPVMLRPDERLKFDRANDRCSIERVDAGNYCRWFSSHLVFDNTPLADIVTNLERRYNVEIVVSPGISLTKRLSFVVYREPLEDIMEVMSSLMPVRFEIMDNIVVLSAR